jgi:hypothetical protein
MTDQAIILAQEAWARIKGQGKPLFTDWILIGKALIAARTACLAKAGVNSLYHPAYRRQVRMWLVDNGFDDLDSHERANSVHLVEHQAEIEAWRAGLSDAERRRCNHPNSVWGLWRKRSAPQRSGPKKPSELQARVNQLQQELAAERARADRLERELAACRREAEARLTQRTPNGSQAIHWHQSHIRAGAMAMSKARSADYFIMARKCLEAAAPDVASLLPLMEPPATAPRRAPAAQTMETIDGQQFTPKSSFEDPRAATTSGSRG